MENRTPIISFCITCMGRLYQLRETLPANLELMAPHANVEFVILNYNSPDELHEWMREQHLDLIRAGRIRYALNPAPERFHASKAKNQAHRLATGDILVNLDADNFIGGSYGLMMEWFARNFDICLHMFSGTYGDGSFGRIAMARKHFLALGGYDESFMPMGAQDRDLIRRARAYGLKKIHVSDSRIGHALVNDWEAKMKFTGYTADDFQMMNRANLSAMRTRLDQGRFLANEGTHWGVPESLVQL